MTSVHGAEADGSLLGSGGAYAWNKMETRVVVKVYRPIPAQRLALLPASSGDGPRQIVVRGLGADVQLGEDRGGASQRVSRRGMTRNSFDLSYRFVLSDAAQQGAQAWPVRLSVTPL